ncbi:matrix metallopeptidase-21-like, partial [Salvelinus fontinalis]|uniref:matrix metallopeptidase-21-like n=1 Tax=Salvelinus fontinalis TaxID=8038 RepID=UPI00248537C7
ETVRASSTQCLVCFPHSVCFPLGDCKGQFNTVFDWIRKERSQYGEVVIRFNTYFMRDGWYWLYENRTNRTRYGDPVALQMGWHGIPTDGVDACVHVWNRNTDAVYFFKGTQYWRYDDDNDQVLTVDPEGHLYPRLISEGFPGVPSPIDTAFYDRRDYHIYFFKGTYVYVFDVTANRLAPGFPRKITAVFPAVVSGDHPGGNIDAAYFSYTHNAVFLFKETQFWRVVGRSRERWRRPSLPRNGLMPHRKVEEQWFDICNVHPSALKVSRR